jgi:hypothetical protein
MFEEHDTLRYALLTCGGGAMFFAAWWIFCLTVRGLIDGVVLGLCLIRFKRYGEDLSELGER